MDPVASISPASSSLRTGALDRLENWPGSFLSSVKAVKSPSSVTSLTNAALNPPTAKTVTVANPLTQDLTMGLLMSVSQPSGGNSDASLDYQSLRIALESDNLSAAQTAYERLQSDLLLAHPNQLVTTNHTSGNTGHLNTAA